MMKLRLIIMKNKGKNRKLVRRYKVRGMDMRLFSEKYKYKEWIKNELLLRVNYLIK